jgi:hypothetical protein
LRGNETASAQHIAAALEKRVAELAGEEQAVLVLEPNDRRAITLKITAKRPGGFTYLPDPNDVED